MENQNEEKIYEKVEVLEGQVETGIEYNEVTNDDSIQDLVNTDGIDELVGEGAEIINE